VIITYRILSRRRKRLNIVFSGFFISTIIGNLLNMIYYLMTDRNLIILLNFLTNFFIVFGAIFLLTVNRTLLESTIVFSIKRQNIAIALYGITLLIGMVTLLVLGENFDFDILGNDKPFLGITVTGKGAPWWGIIFFIYIFLFSMASVVIPIVRTSLKILKSFETYYLKRKWLYYFVGCLGTFSIFYLINVGNVLNDDTFKLAVSVYGISIILWVSLMYYGLGYRLQESK
ncbi:MAG: hypothetical protein ACXAAI_04780, partial [Promethearchaeota archaeon]